MCVGGCMGTTGPASINPATGQPYGLDFPVVTIARHGARPGHADRPSRHRHAVLRRRRLDGRHAGAAMGGELSRARLLRHADRHGGHAIRRRTSPSTRSAGRRSWPIPTGAAAAISKQGVRPAKGLAVARMAAHITYLSEPALQRKFGRNLQDRDGADLLLRRRFPGRELSALSGLDLRRPLRRQFLSLRDARLDYFDLAADYGGSLAQAFKGTKTRFCVVSFTSDWLYPTADSRAIVHALNAGGASVSFVEIDSDKGHDAFLLDEPEFFATTRGFLEAAARGAGPAAGQRGDDSAMNAAHFPPRERSTRVDLAAGRRRWSSRARACSTSAAATARCCNCWRDTKQVDGRGDRTVAEAASMTASPRAFGHPGRRRHRSRRLSRRRLRLCDPVADAAGDAQPAARCSSTCCASAGAPSSPFPISAIGASAGNSLLQGRMPVTENLSYAWYDTPNIHLCTIRDFVGLVDVIDAHIERGVALDRNGAPDAGQRALVGVEPVRRAGGVPARTRRRLESVFEPCGYRLA